jgi:hypothetical protein
MTLLGLELSDAGILVAGDNPARLLTVDGQEQESPGFAIPEKERLLVGKSASDKAHLFPILGSIEYRTFETKKPACTKSC